MLATRALARAGLSDADAATVAGVLIQADMMGISTHGMVRLSPYTTRLRNGAVDPKAVPGVDQRAASLALVDGNNAHGPVVATAALEAAMRIAGETGIAYVGCRGSNHLGALVPYALRACEAGFVMLAGTGASATMPPFGGVEARIGNNPLCVAAPCPEGPHFILDMAMSVAARGKIRAARDAGQSIPEGWAVDAAGQPTTDPVRALEGFLVAVGGHKGSGLSMASDILSDVMAGARFLTGISSWTDNIDAPQQLGHFFLLIDPARLIGRDAFAKAMASFSETVRSATPADPKVPVMLPGEREQKMMAEAARLGVPLKDEILAEVKALADG